MSRMYTLAAAIALGSLALVYLHGAQAHHCKGPHMNDPGCDGGGGGDSDAAVPLMTVFDCPLIDSNHLGCPATGNHNRLQADVAGTPYEDDMDNVLNRIAKSGRFALSTGARKKKPKPRSVFWDVRHVDEVGIPLPNSGLMFTTTEDMDAQAIAHRTVIHVGSDFAGQGGDLRTMQTGVTVDMDLWVDINLETGQGDDQILLRFDPYGDKCFGRITSAVQVTRTVNESGKSRWTVDVAAGAVACLYNFDPALPEGLGDYPFGPLRLVADEL